MGCCGIIFILPLGWNLSNPRPKHGLTLRTRGATCSPRTPLPFSGSSARTRAGKSYMPYTPPKLFKDLPPRGKYLSPVGKTLLAVFPQFSFQNNCKSLPGEEWRMSFSSPLPPPEYVIHKSSIAYLERFVNMLRVIFVIWQPKNGPYKPFLEPVVTVLAYLSHFMER